ncbi:MAG: MYXO-CTERM sorting domain-containing protein [Pseudomonadota bacterium]
MALAVMDDDGFLSGDAILNDMADDASGQTADITVNGLTAGNGGQIYAETLWTVTDGSDIFLLVEIEQEGAAADYFSLIDIAPAAGFPNQGAMIEALAGANVDTQLLPYGDIGTPSDIPVAATLPFLLASLAVLATRRRRS